MLLCRGQGESPRTSKFFLDACNWYIISPPNVELGAIGAEARKAEYPLIPGARDGVSRK
jgi:hypothetical protein